MRVTLWQQFSSNHSAYFSIVGRFANESSALEASQLLRQWMQRILWEGGNRGELSPTEKEIIETYNIKWYEAGLDWNGTPDSLAEVVQQFQNDVFLMCPLETWDAHQPFEELMGKIGATFSVSYRGEPYEGDIQITSIAPNEEVANQFVEHTLNEFSKPYPQRRYLWMKYDEKYGYHRQGHSIDSGKLHQNGKVLDMHFEFYKTLDVYILLQYLADNQYTEIKYEFIPNKKA